MKHTSGPWKYSKENGVLEIWNQNTFVARINDRHKYHSVDDEANACLIASAPELLEALDGVIQILRNYQGDIPACIEADLYGPLKDAYAAIAKATGGAE